MSEHGKHRLRIRTIEFVRPIEGPVAYWVLRLENGRTIYMLGLSDSSSEDA